MTILAHTRGHTIIWYDECWIYEDTKKRIDNGKPRPCKNCGRMPTEEGYDACMGYVPGMESVCCGHGTGNIIMKETNQRRDWGG